MRVAILTVSDRCARGEARDETGPALREMMQQAGAEVFELALAPDEQAQIRGHLLRLCEAGAEVILTNGGTGFAPRDVTPEATRGVIERPVPGLPEAMRMRTLSVTADAMLSRGCAGIRGRTLIVNLPGSARGARECLEVILPVLDHAVEMLAGGEHACAHRDRAPAQEVE
jgi:molybdenum cofactor synthesis domain-containing protein